MIKESLKLLLVVLYYFNSIWLVIVRPEFRNYIDDNPLALILVYILLLLSIMLAIRKADPNILVLPICLVISGAFVSPFDSMAAILVVSISTSFFRQYIFAET